MQEESRESRRYMCTRQMAIVDGEDEVTKDLVGVAGKSCSTLLRFNGKVIYKWDQVGDFHSHVQGR